jgi:hypothetical protein
MYRKLKLILLTKIMPTIFHSPSMQFEDSLRCWQAKHPATHSGPVSVNSWTITIHNTTPRTIDGKTEVLMDHFKLVGPDCEQVFVQDGSTMQAGPFELTRSGEIISFRRTEINTTRHTLDVSLMSSQLAQVKAAFPHSRYISLNSSGVHYTGCTLR